MPGERVGSERWEDKRNVWKRRACGVEGESRERRGRERGVGKEQEREVCRGGGMHERVHAKESAWVQAHTNKRERDRQGIGLRDIPNECLGFAGEIFNFFFQILALIVEFLADLIEVGVLCFESFDFL